MNKLIDNFVGKRILVLGDLIVDEYRDCEAIGKSAESPTIVVKEKKIDRYIGGAGIIALHLKALGAEPFLVSVIGNDKLGKYGFDSLRSVNLESLILFDCGRETTLKIRYISDNHKLLRVSHLSEKLIEEKFEDEIINRIKLSNKKNKLDGIIISDFNYGVVTPKILKSIKAFALRNKIKIFGDSQTSSQYGDIKKFSNFTMITPNEIEARRALGDNYSEVPVLADKLLKSLNVENIVITLGHNGLFAKNKSEFIALPAFGGEAKERMGAGDSFLSCASLALCSGASIKEAVMLGSMMAAVKIGIIGNIPVGVAQLKEGLLKYKKEIKKYV